MIKYNWTVVCRDINGGYISTHHYIQKRDALTEVSYQAGLGHIVIMTKWSVWFTGAMEVDHD